MAKNGQKWLKRTPNLVNPGSHPKSQRPRISMTPNLDDPESRQPRILRTPNLNDPKSRWPQISTTPNLDNPKSCRPESQRSWILTTPNLVDPKIWQPLISKTLNSEKWGPKGGEQWFLWFFLLIDSSIYCYRKPLLWKWLVWKLTNKKSLNAISVFWQKTKLLTWHTLVMEISVRRNLSVVVKTSSKRTTMRLHVHSFSSFFCLAGSFVLFVNLHARSFIWSIIGCFGHYLSQNGPMDGQTDGRVNGQTDRRTDPLIEMRKPHLKTTGLH